MPRTAGILSGDQRYKSIGYEFMGGINAVGIYCSLTVLDCGFIQSKNHTRHLGKRINRQYYSCFTGLRNRPIPSNGIPSEACLSSRQWAFMPLAIIPRYFSDNSSGFYCFFSPYYFLASCFPLCSTSGDSFSPCAQESIFKWGQLTPWWLCWCSRVIVSGAGGLRVGG